jgi:hypothetical protein
MLAGIWASPRPSELAFAALLLSAVFLYVPFRLSFGAAKTEAVRQQPIHLVQPSWPFRTDDIDERGELLVPETVSAPGGTGDGTLGRDRRNLFAFGKLKTPTPPPRAQRAAQVRPPPTPRTPLPAVRQTRPSWTCPLSLLGLGRHPDYAIAWFKDTEGGIYVAAEGTEVDVMAKDKVVARCRLKSVMLDKVQLENPSDPQQHQTLSLGGAK